MVKTAGDIDFVQNTRKFHTRQNSTIAFGMFEFGFIENRAITDTMLK